MTETQAALEAPAESGLTERLLRARQRAFVGRTAELSFFAQLLRDPKHSLFFVTGHAGIGKSALLRQLQRLALTERHPVAFIDGRQLAQGPAQARALLREQLHYLREASRPLTDGPRRVLLVDDVHELSTEYDWLLTEVADAFAGDLLLVLASRREVPPGLYLDAAWHSVMVHRELTPLVDADALKLLEQRAVSPAAHDAILDAAAGHPLALALAADVAQRAPQGFTLSGLHELHHALSRVLCPHGISPGQQLALDICAMARATTAELIDVVATPLGAAVGAEVRDLFDWLERQSFIELTPIGVRPHLLSRIALQTRLRRERPRRYRAISQALREFSVSELETSSNPESDLVNLFFLDRDVPLVRRWSPPLEQVPVHPLTRAEPADRAEVLDLIRRAEGDEAAALAAACWQREGDVFEVVRDNGLSGLLHLTRFDAAGGPGRLHDDDPASALLQRFVAEHPLHDHEESLVFRWFMDREDYQTPSARVLAITGRQTQLILAGKQLAYSFCVFRAPADWIALWKNIGLPWQLVGRFTLGGHEYSLLVFMWRRRALRDVLVQAWRHPGGDPSPSSKPSFDELRIKVGERVARLAQKINLTPREVEILEQLCLGLSLEDIAKKLSIRPRTVKFHQENLLRKTGASSRVELFKKLL